MSAQPRPILTLVLCGLAYAGMTGCGSAGHASAPRVGSPPIPALAAPEILPVTADSSVRVLALDFETYQRSDASGFLVSSDGLLVTCRHVIAGKTPLGVIFTDGQHEAVSEVLAEDEEHDLVLLRVGGGGNFPYLRLSTAQPSPGEKVWAVTRYGVTDGMITKPFTDAAVGDVVGFADALLKPGTSGGALVDGRGEVVGVIRGAVDDDPLEGGAIPVERVRQLLDAAGPNTRPDRSPSGGSVPPTRGR